MNKYILFVVHIDSSMFPSDDIVMGLWVWEMRHLQSSRELCTFSLSISFKDISCISV